MPFYWYQMIRNEPVAHVLNARNCHANGERRLRRWSLGLARSMLSERNGEQEYIHRIPPDGY